MRAIRLLIAAMVMSLCQSANALTVLVDAAWVRAGLGSAGDRCLDDALLDLKPGDRLDLILPTLGESTTLSPIVGFILHRRPSIRAAELIATRRLLNRVLATADPSDWPRLTQILTRVAATPDPDRGREGRYVIIGALTAANPPAVDLALQRLLRGRQITVIDLAPLNSKLYDSRLKAWRRFFAAAGAVQVAILPPSARSPSEPWASQPRAPAIDCSGRRLQVLDH